MDIYAKLNMQKTQLTIVKEDRTKHHNILMMSIITCVNKL